VQAFTFITSYPNKEVNCIEPSSSKKNLENPLTLQYFIFARLSLSVFITSNNKSSFLLGRLLALPRRLERLARDKW
jgi:hypothetical protein